MIIEILFVFGSLQRFSLLSVFSLPISQSRSQASLFYLAETSLYAEMNCVLNSNKLSILKKAGTNGGTCEEQQTGV